jgi:hypothetical protein
MSSLPKIINKRYTKLTAIKALNDKVLLMNCF